MTIKITYKDLDIEPCNPYKLYILENYGKDKKFDPLELIKKFKKDYEDVSWLICYCNYYQTLAMLTYYKSLNPNAADVNWLIRYCEYFLTPENKELLLKDLK